MSLEMSAKDKKLLVYLVSLAIVALTYFFVVRPFLDKNEKLNEQVQVLQQEVNELTEIYNHQDEYEANIAAEHEKVDKALAKFPGGITQENTLMMLLGIENSTNTWISRVSFAEVQYISGGGSGEEFIEIAEESSDSELEEDLSASADEGAVNSEDLYAGNMSTLRQDLSLDYSSSYDNFKKFIDYIENYDSRLFISSLNASYSPEANEVSGSVTLSQFAVEGAGKTLEKPDLSGVALGVDNIFTTLHGTTGSGEGEETLQLGELTLPDSNGEESGGEDTTEGEENTESEESEGARS